MLNPIFIRHENLERTVRPLEQEQPYSDFSHCGSFGVCTDLVGKIKQTPQLLIGILYNRGHTKIINTEKFQ